MKFTAAWVVAGALWPFSVGAVCVVTPLEQELRAAAVVYVGTVVRSELVGALPSSKEAQDPRDRLIKLRHIVRPEITFKGNAAGVPAVLSSWQYNSPLAKRAVEFAELLPVQPGDTLLVVSQPGGTPHVGLCSPSRKWTAEARRVAGAVFPPAP